MVDISYYTHVESAQKFKFTHPCSLFSMSHCFVSLISISPNIYYDYLEKDTIWNLSIAGHMSFLPEQGTEG